MVDLGFKDLIDRFEKHFGERLTAIALGMLMLCFVLLVAGLTTQTVLIPLFSHLGAFLLGGESTRQIAAGFNFSVFVVVLAFIIYMSFQVFFSRKRIRAWERKHAETERQAAALNLQAIELLRQAREATESNQYALLKLREGLLEWPNGPKIIDKLMNEDANIAAAWSDYSRLPTVGNRTAEKD